MKMELTAERLRTRLLYDPLTGAFTRAVSVAKFKKGELAGCTALHGGKKYIRIGVDGREYYAQRLAWLYMTGQWPNFEVDHFDGDSLNNRWSNLRDVPHTANNQNQRRAHSDNPVGLLGVSWVGRKSKYRASLTIKRKSHFLGYFDSPEEAHAAYIVAKRQAHEGCTL